MWSNDGVRALESIRCEAAGNPAAVVGNDGGAGSEAMTRSFTSPTMLLLVSATSVLSDTSPTYQSAAHRGSQIGPFSKGSLLNVHLLVLVMLQEGMNQGNEIAHTW